ncbi:MAG: MgtC/SapB family protein [Bacteroidetes bacterium]|nr:MgtC/SapB family protein [Bacteroidota bacterium]
MHEYLMELLGANQLALLVAIGIGLVAGIEREIDAQPEYKHFAGIRTMPLIAALGCIITFVAKETSMLLIVSVITSFFIFLTAIYYSKNRTGSVEVKHEIMLLIVFVLGILAGLHLFREALVTTVIMISILSLKEKFHSVIDQLTKLELLAFIKFAILSIIVIPFIPDKKLGPDGILNPQSISWVVVIVSSLSFIGYFLMKFGKSDKSILFTAILGGLFSSTAVTWLYSSKSRENPSTAHLYACGILLANAVMFCRVLFWTVLFNSSVFFILAMPNIIMTLTLLTITFIILIRNAKVKFSESINLGNPVDLNNAIGFAAIYACIIFMVYYGNKYFGSIGLYLSGIISGFSDVDAITINMSKLAKSGTQLHTSTIVIILAMLSNGLVKLGISLFRGDKKVKQIVGYSLAFIIAFGIITSLVINKFHS